MNIKKLIYNLFFKKKKKRTGRKASSNSADNTAKTSSAASKKNKAAGKGVYDIEALRQRVSETEYISNLRIGRSWILPQLVQMGFTSKRLKMTFDMELLEQNIRMKYDYSQTGRRRTWDLLKQNYRFISNANGATIRTVWWTKEVFVDVIQWDFKMVGRRSRGLNRKKCIEILNSVDALTSPTQILQTIEEYDQARMRKRETWGVLLPNSFIDAYMGDGAYSAMMTMVKILEIRFSDDEGQLLTRDECINEIDRLAQSLTGRELMEFCKEKFFDSGAFEYKKYINNRPK